MLIQIYEIRNALEARLVAATGVDHVGVLVGDGEFPREINIETARPILSAIPATSRKVVLTLSRSIERIETIADQLQPDILHLGTVPEGISPEMTSGLKKKFPRMKIMRSIPVIGDDSIEIAKQYDEIADFLLLDSHKEDDNQVGATGWAHDWKVSRKIVEQVKTPIILAGGLGLDNVGEAIRIVRPAGVDSKTRTDKNGTQEKDLLKIKQFVEAARSVRC